MDPALGDMHLKGELRGTTANQKKPMSQDLQRLLSLGPPPKKTKTLFLKDWVNCEISYRGETEEPQMSFGGVSFLLEDYVG